MDNDPRQTDADAMKLTPQPQPEQARPELTLQRLDAEMVALTDDVERMVGDFYTLRPQRCNRE
jgi:hypothetical protein